MNENKIVKFRCSRCGETVEGTMHPFIDAGCQANLKQEIINGTLFAFVCPHCGYRTNLGYDLVYLDRKKKLLISLSHESHADKMPSFSDLSIEESERDQYTVRIVHTPSDLREKILIRDAGLSDQAVELMKVLITSEIQSQENVLVDDLVTKESVEPYRMMTSRAEYRLLLRQDNADLRLTEIGHRIGLISEERYQKYLDKKKNIEEEIERLKSYTVGGTNQVQEFLDRNGSTRLLSGCTLAELLKRPELTYEKLEEIDPERPALPADVCEQAEIEIKYEGYIARQKRQVEEFRKLENKKLSTEIDYSSIKSLRLEAAQKLNDYKPSSIGQASRIQGVSPSDISVLLVWLKNRQSRKGKD